MMSTKMFSKQVLVGSEYDNRIGDLVPQSGDKDGDGEGEGEGNGMGGWYGKRGLRGGEKGRVVGVEGG